MAVENNHHPLINDDLYNQIRQKFALPKTEQGKLKYVGLYETAEPYLAERLRAISDIIADGYRKDLLAANVPINVCDRIAKALSKDVYAMSWYGYMFCDRVHDVNWERDMRAMWERDYKTPGFNPNEQTNDDDAEPV